MDRRTFSSAGVTLTAAGAFSAKSLAQESSAPPFNLKYAPNFKHFVHSAGKNPLGYTD